MTISIFASPKLRRLSAPLRALIRTALAAEGRRAREVAVMLTDDAELRALNREWRCIDRATDVLSFSYDEAGAGETVRREARRVSRVPGDARRSPGARLTGNPSRPRVPVNGDVVISLDRVRDQARRYRVSEGAELARLVIHGALHLAGLDHQRPAERRRMRKREDAVLRASRSEARALDRELGPATGVSRRSDVRRPRVPRDPNPRRR